MSLGLSPESPAQEYSLCPPLSACLLSPPLCTTPTPSYSQGNQSGLLNSSSSLSLSGGGWRDREQLSARHSINFSTRKTSIPSPVLCPAFWAELFIAPGSLDKFRSGSHSLCVCVSACVWGCVGLVRWGHRGWEEELGAQASSPQSRCWKGRCCCRRSRRGGRVLWPLCHWERAVPTAGR